MSHITKAELDQLLGGATPTGIQCVFTFQDKDAETFEMCEQDEANHVSVYIRTENGEVVPVRDFPVIPGHMYVPQGYALKATCKICELLGTLPLEPHGALQ